MELQSFLSFLQISQQEIQVVGSLAVMSIFGNGIIHGFNQIAYKLEPDADKIAIDNADASHTLRALECILVFGTLISMLSNS